MPAYNREMERIKALFSGDNQANFATWAPLSEQGQQGANLAQNPAIYNQQSSQSPTRAMLGETPLFSDSLKSSNNYQDALRRRMTMISGMSTEANARAFAAQQAALNPGNYGGEVYSGANTTDPERLRVLKAAAGAVGLPYSWGGGNSKGASYGLSGAGERHGSSKIYGFDCSGLVQYAYAQAGISMPRLAGQQAARGIKTSISKLQPGDLVGKPGHIAIYAGNGMMYEAPTFGKRVRLVPVRSGMFGIHFNL